MNKDFAISAKQYALCAVENFSQLLTSAKAGGCSQEEYLQLHKEIGLLIGSTHMRVLEMIYKQYPDLDDLKD
jgi:hypothetical protein